MSFIKNTTGQSVIGTLVRLVDGTRYTNVIGMTTRVANDGVWSDGAGTLEIIETNNIRYTFTQTETDASQIDLIIDHADAATPITYTIFPTVADFDPSNDPVSIIPDGSKLTIEPVSSKTSLQVIAETGVLTTNLQDALIFVAQTGRVKCATRITAVSGSAPNFTLTVNPALPEAPSDGDVFILGPQYLAAGSI